MINTVVFKRAKLGIFFVFFACAVLFVRSNYVDAANRIDTAYSKMERSDWNATNVWLESAECMRTTGAWLAICGKPRLEPFGEYSLADDGGHALLLGLWSRIANKKINFVHVAKLNLVFNALGCLWICLLLFSVRAYIAGIILFTTSSSIFFGWIGIAPHPGLIGIAAMAAILPASLAFWKTSLMSRCSQIFFLISGLGLLSLVALVRQPIGMICFVSSLIVLGVRYRVFFTDRRSMLGAVVLLFAIFGLSQSPKIAVLARDALFDVAKPQRIQEHGISHNLYIGLGVVDNSFGIRWDDSVGMADARKIDPDVQYVSPRYYQVLWKAYFQRVAENPLEVVRIYAKKTMLVAEEKYPAWGITLFWTLPCLLIYGFFVYQRQLWVRAGFNAAPALFLLSWLFIAFYFMQGVIANPSPQYGAPMAVFVAIIFGTSLELFCRLIILQNDEREST
jgi:hypothetical protein